MCSDSYILSDRPTAITMVWNLSQNKMVGVEMCCSVCDGAIDDEGVSTEDSCHYAGWTCGSCGRGFCDGGC